ncbi:hypothetical protein GALMADRAFT_147726 [Galerina marginata CBS 339.88]|uniref:(S)-ureidoglycine aminohydrolase cupin domain-containing protein n=1 Tax=Galerina marginata (strain CBS 339.88) TaxID=685588 RepID=A0A067SIS9_GALM3|nr:hypothetical protein GALMADRAFT_147726 [Galerina marginata CBS 339.88]
MPKHIPSEHYLGTPYELFPKGTIHPEIEHHPTDAEHYLLPAVFTLEKGDVATLKYPGPGVYYIIEGEIQYEDTAKPGKPTVLNAGAVLHIEEGSALRWYSPSVAKGFAVFNVPVSIKSFDAFVVSE